MLYILLLCRIPAHAIKSCSINQDTKYRNYKDDESQDIAYDSDVVEYKIQQATTVRRD